MRIISRKKLRDFWEKHPETAQSLKAWFADVKQAQWKNPDGVKTVYKNASIIPDNRVVFNIKGNKYRLVVAVQYNFGIVFIRFIGTHKEYDSINAATI